MVNISNIVDRSFLRIINPLRSRLQIITKNRLMIIVVVLLTYLFIYPEGPYALTYTYPQGEDCGIQAMAHITGLPAQQLRAEIGHDWTWEEDLTRALRRHGIHWRAGVLGVSDLGDSGALLLYRGHWYHVIKEYPPGYYKTWNRITQESYVDVKYLDGMRMIILEDG